MRLAIIAAVVVSIVALGGSGVAQESGSETASIAAEDFQQMDTCSFCPAKPTCCPKIEMLRKEIMWRLGSCATHEMPCEKEPGELQAVIAFLEAFCD